MKAPPIHCAHDQVVELEKLKPNPANPNTHPEAQIKLLAKIIAGQGWRNPIVVSNRSGFITKGHARLSAAQLLGLPVAPVDFQDYSDENAEWADMLWGKDRNNGLGRAQIDRRGSPNSETNRAFYTAT